MVRLPCQTTPRQPQYPTTPHIAIASTHKHPQTTPGNPKPQQCFQILTNPHQHHFTTQPGTPKPPRAITSNHKPHQATTNTNKARKSDSCSPIHGMVILLSPSHSHATPTHHKANTEPSQAPTSTHKPHRGNPKPQQCLQAPTNTPKLYNSTPPGTPNPPTSPHKHPQANPSSPKQPQAATESRRASRPLWAPTGHRRKQAFELSIKIRIP